MRDFAVYLLYRASSAIVAALPLPAVFRIGELFGLVAWLVLARYRRLAADNVSVGFAGKKSTRELKKLVRLHFRRLGANLLSSVKISTMSPEQIAQRVEFQNLEPMGSQLRAGVPVVLLLSHLSNWELFSTLMSKCYPFVQPATIYQRLSNRWIDSHVQRARSRSGLLLFDRSKGFKPVIDFLRASGNVAVFSDQHAGDNGLWAPFFNKLASTSPLAALLAKRTGAAVFAGAVYTEGTAHWRLVLTDQIQATNDSVETLTAKGNTILEQQIRVAPEDWFWVHDRWKTPRPNFLLRKYKRGVYVPGEMSAQGLTPFRILIRSSNWLGDAVMSVPAVRAIKRGRPDAHVTVLTSADLASMWKLISDVDDVITANTASVFSVVRAIRQQPKFDVAILFPNSMRTALEVWLGGIRRRVGYRGHRRAWLLNQIVRERGKPRPPEHQARRYLRMAQELGASIDDSSSVGQTVSFPRDTDNVPYSSASAPPTVPVRLGLCPGAEYGPAKRWLPERFADAAAAIAAEYPAEWVLFGKSGDAAVGETIAKTLGERCVNRIGQTTLQQLVDELRTCRLLLTNDTGTMHLSALLGIPTVAIFGSTEPRLTGPLGNNHLILRHHVECSPCFLRQCPIDFRCMKAVGVDEVVRSVLSLLDRSGSVSRHRH